MNKFGIEVSIKNPASLDPKFLPLSLFNKAFLTTAKQPLALALERPDGQISTYETFVHGTPERAEADRYYVDRLVKALLWQCGGFRVHVCGNEDMYRSVAGAYCVGGSRAFDFDFMSGVYERPFEVVHASYEDRPQAKQSAQPIGRHLKGCRIGFDAGGSDRKVSAVVDGEVTFSEEVVWHPVSNADPDYHYEGIVSAFKQAASHMPRVDAIGISSAGIYVNNRTMVASLFRAVPKDLFEQKIKDIYLRAAKEIGDVPVAVANDGDVSALAGAMGMNVNNLLGLAMGTSEAGGFVDAEGNITGWLNELAFIPVDANENANEDEWSGDIGCGRVMFSQDGVIHLAPAAGVDLSAAETHAEKLKIAQALMAQDDPRAAEIYRNLGVYLGHAVPFYEDLYHMDHILLLGRVMSGKGGDLIVSEARRVLMDEYPDCHVNLALPDENTRRVGQSVAAASLPQIDS
ncbi:ROK family protein [Eubacteriales bacterium OttesenSCG-928-N13]|nr:ROK family protein [Eubacteriales bacterium OttesenSCG-928-N13]